MGIPKRRYLSRVSIKYRMRGYYSIETVRNSQTKQYTNDVHRLSTSRRVLNSAYRARNTADSLKSMGYKSRETIRDRFDEVHSLNSRLNRLLNRPDIDEMNDRIEVKKNTKWDYGLSHMDDLMSICKTKTLPCIFDLKKFTPTIPSRISF